MEREEEEMVVVVVVVVVVGGGLSGGGKGRAGQGRVREGGEGQRPVVNTNRRVKQVRARQRQAGVQVRRKRWVGVRCMQTTTHLRSFRGLLTCS